MVLNFSFQNKKKLSQVEREKLKSIISDFTIEVMPKTAAKIEDFSIILPKGTNIYIAHLEGVNISDMLETASKILKAGFNVIPHFPARLIKDKITLEDWVNKYNSIGVQKALLLAGSPKEPIGEYSNSMELLETGLFNNNRFSELFCAGHPEGNSDIDGNGEFKNVMKALNWKQDFARKSKISLSITTQFCFEIEPIIKWEENLKEAKIDLPINIGVAGPAKLQTLIKYAISCGVGPSMRVLEKRAKDITQLILPYTPKSFIADLATYKEQNAYSNIRSIHFFPLGGILNTTNFVKEI